MRPSANQCAVLQLEDGRRRAHLVLVGSVPSKKNNRSHTGARAHYDKETAAAIETLIDQARLQWRRRPALDSPEMHFTVFCVNARQDIDGILTTLLDVLVKAGVLFDDSIRWCNGLKVILPATICDPRDARAEVTLYFAEEVE